MSTTVHGATTREESPPSSTPTPIPRRKRTPVTWFRGGGLQSVLFAIPVVLIFTYFSWGPILQGLILSFQKTNLVAEPTWVGLSNFEYVLTDPGLGQAALNTVYFAFLALLFGFPVPIILAVLINELRKYDGLYNALAYLPAIIPPVAAILLWKFFYDPSATGMFNTMLSWVGLGPLPWLNSEALAMPSIVLYATWAGAGSTAIIYIAALRTVSTELYEAAEIDGASIWRRMWSVTVPQLRGVILVMMLLQLIGTFQIFTEPFLFTGGGPNNATQTILLKIYNYAFVYGDFGAATALSVMLAAFLCLLSAVYLWVTKRWSPS